MPITDYQISNVIKTYMKNMKNRAGKRKQDGPEDIITISEEGIKRMLFDRIETKMTERLRKPDIPV